MKLLAILILAFAGMGVSAQSLAERTGEKVELYTALSVEAGHPLTKAEYRLAAAAQAAKVGLSYDQSAMGNIAILNATEIALNANGDMPAATSSFAAIKAVYGIEAQGSATAMKVVETTQALELGYTADSVVVLLGGRTVLSAPRQIIYIGEPKVARIPDTVFVETVLEVPTDFCPCGEYVSMEKVEKNYFAYRELIRKETDSYEKRKLIACRIRMGEIVRSYWRYGGGHTDANKSVQSKPRAALMSNKSVSHGGQKSSGSMKSTKAGKKKSLFACAKAAKSAK